MNSVLKYIFILGFFFSSHKNMYKANLVVLIILVILLALKDPEGIHSEEARKKHYHNARRRARKTRNVMEFCENPTKEGRKECAN